MDQGLDIVWKFAEKVIFPHVEQNELLGVVDFKTQFQEYVHQQNKGDVTYNLIKRRGTGTSSSIHFRSYSAREAIAEGKGKRKESEQRAAESAYKQLKQIK